MDRYLRRIDVGARRGTEPWWCIAERYGIVSVQTRQAPAPDGDRPRGLAAPLPNGAMNAVVEHCEPRADVQLIIGRGRTDSAVCRGLPTILPELLEGSATRGLSVGRPIAVRPYRLGAVEAVARLLAPRVVVLLTAGWRTSARTVRMSALVAASPEWDTRPACQVRLHGDRCHRTELLQPISDVCDVQAVRLVLDVAYALAAGQGCPVGTLLDAMPHEREAYRPPQWNPDGLPETGR